MSEDGTNQLNALNETGIGRYKVKIVPASTGLKTISGWVSQAMIRLNGVKRVTIDGNNGLGAKYLTFRNKYGTTPTIQFQNETGVDTVKNCTIEGANTNTSSGVIYFSSTTNNAGIGNDSICVNSCDIRDRSDSTGFMANGIYSYGTSTTLLTYNNYNSIINCNIYNYFYDASATYAGIYIYYYNSDWTISGNSFYQTSSRAPVNAINASDIYIYNSTNWDFNITNNYFGGTAPSCGGTTLTYNSAAAFSIYGIYMYISYLNVPSSIQGNTFANINLTTSPAATSSTFYRSIYVSAGYVNIGNLTGNTVGSPTGTGNITLTTNTSNYAAYTIAMINHFGIGAIMNNSVGSITFAGNSTDTSSLYAGIYYSNTTYGQTYTISNNLVGSLTTANSIQCTNQSNYHALRGIYVVNGSGTTNYYTNNIVANITSFSTIGLRVPGSSALVSVYGLQHAGSGVASPCYFTGNTVRNLTVNMNIPIASYACLGIGASGYDFNTILNNNVYSLYSLGIGTGTPLLGGYLCGGATGGLCAYNKAYDFKNTGIGASNPYPLILGINCQNAGTWNIYNNMVCLTNGDPTERLIIQPKYNEKFEQVRVENPPINLMAIPKENNKIIQQTPLEVGPLNLGVYDEKSPNKQNIQQIIKKNQNNVNKNGKDNITSTAVCTIAGFYHTNYAVKNPCNYYYNSVYIGGTMPGNSFNSYDFIRNANSGLVNIQNNIFVNSRSGGGGFHYCIANESSIVEGWPANSTNYNLYIGNANTIGEWGLGNFQSLAQWQASSLGDANTVSANPTNIPGTTLFRSIGTDNLNIDTTQFGAAYVYKNGIGVTGIANDYNGYPRATSGPVCIGAHEFSLNGNTVSTLLLPANGSTGNQTPVAMKWRKALFASSYRILIATDSLFTNIITTGTSPDTNYSFTGANPLTYYYWKVNPVYSTGANGASSTFFSFKVIGTPNVPVLNSPANNAVNQPITITFNWFKTNDQSLMLKANGKNTKQIGQTMGPNSIANYWFEISTDSTFATGVTKDSSLTDSTKTLTLLNATTYFWHVKAKNQFGWGNFSTRWSFTTVVPMPTAPVLTSPPNGATNVNPNVVLSWNAVQYAASYRIQVADSTKDTVNFTTFVKDTSGVTIAQLSLSLPYSRTHWWRVNATNYAGTGPYSTVFKFRTSSDPTALSMSNYISVLCPKYMSSGTAARLPVAVRGTVQGLVPNKTYRYYNMMGISTDIGTTAAGAGILMLVNTTTGTFTYSSLGSLTTSGQYETFVANSSGNYTGWFGSLNSGNARFTAGNYVYPTIVLGDSVGTLLARYAMNDSIQVLAVSASTGATYGSGVFGISLGVPKNFVALYDNVAGTGKPLSTSWIENQGYTFTASTAIQFYVDSVNLFNGRWGNLLPNTLAGGLQRVEQRSLTTGAVLSFNTSATGLWPGGANTVNPATGTTPIRLALYDAPLLNPPVLLTPTSGSVDLSTTPTLTWTISNVAVGYRIQINTDSTFAAANALDTAGVTGLTFTVPSGKLTTNTKYYWRMYASNALGVSLWGSPWNFRTAPNAPSAPILVSPPNYSINIPTTMTCVWRKAAETLVTTVQINKGKENNGTDVVKSNKISKSRAGNDDIHTLSNYWYEYSTDSTFATGVIRDSSLTDTTKSLTGLSLSTKYFWRVKAKNQTGWGSFSTFFSFTTVPAAPVAPTLSAPTNGQVNVSLTPLIVWNAVQFASTYRIQIADSTKDTVGFTTSTWDTSGVTIAQLTVPAGKLLNGRKYWWRVNATNAGGTGPYSSIWHFTTVASGLPLTLKVYLEGYWNGTSQVTDTVRIFLASSTSPYAYVDTAKLVLSSTGTASPLFMRASGGNYYIVVRHMNHLETWSALPQTFNPGVPVNYDFTTAATQAFGSNMKQVGSVWVLIVGDENQDGSIDAGDAADFINQYGNIGYLTCDFNGDLSVDAADVPFLIANYGLTKVVPTLIEIPPEIRNQKTIIKKNELNEMFKQQKNKNTNKNN